MNKAVDQQKAISPRQLGLVTRRQDDDDDDGRQRRRCIEEGMGWGAKVARQRWCG